MLFLCGVEVEVSFSALYTNVLMVFATLKSIGHHTQDCTVTLSSIPVSIYLCALVGLLLAKMIENLHRLLAKTLCLIINCVVTHNIFGFSLSLV